MQYMQDNKRSIGFTLVEVMIIAPIVILVIGAFVGLIITLTGDVLRTAANNEAAYNVQTALDTIEQDVKLATGFVDPSYTPLVAQGSNHTPSGANPTGNNASLPFTGTSSIKMRVQATTADPINPSRQFVYLDNSPHSGCSNPNITQNTPFMVDVVYYTVTDTSVTPNKYSLWRRVVFPSNYNPASLCGTVWQKPSCSPSVSASGTYTTTCRSEDQEILKDMSAPLSTSVSYYSNPTGTTPLTIPPANPSTASTIEVNLEVLRTVAGREAASSGKIRATSVNYSTTFQSGTSSQDTSAPIKVYAYYEVGTSLTWTGSSTDVFQLSIQCPSGAPVVFMSNSTPSDISISYGSSGFGLWAWGPSSIPCGEVGLATTTIRRFLGGASYSQPLIVKPSDYTD